MGQGADSLFLHLPHLIRSINDPEHPLTLEELNVVEQVRVQVSRSQRLRGQVVRESQKSPAGHQEAGLLSAHGLLRGSWEGGDCCAHFMHEETEACRS